MFPKHRRSFFSLLKVHGVQKIPVNYYELAESSISLESPSRWQVFSRCHHFMKRLFKPVHSRSETSLKAPSHFIVIKNKLP